MLKNSKRFLKKLVPPLVLEVARPKDKKYGFFGNYQSWSDACQHSYGYNSDVILNKVKDALLQVKEGKAAYERDSVLFNEIHYSFPVLAGLLRVAVENDGRLSVLDFGGSLGSSYYQNKQFLPKLKEFRWSIVEQEKFVACGRKFFEDGCLKFFDNIDACLQSEKPDILLVSSVIQYLEHPYFFLEDIISRRLKYIIIDITAFFNDISAMDQLTVQIVPPYIYEASYPAWIFNLNKFLSCFFGQYEMLANFNSLESVELKKISAELKGFIFRRID